MDTYSHAIPALEEEAVRNLGKRLLPVPASQLSWRGLEEGE